MPVTKAFPGKNINSKAEIRKVIDDFFAALCVKDVKRMISCYAADAILFDVKPPFQTKGAIAWKHVWEACIGYFPGKFSITIRDLKIFTGVDLAFAHYMFRLNSKEKDHAAQQTWMRVTTGFKKIQSRWKIVHEHGSLPFNPHTGMAIFTLEP